MDLEGNGYLRKYSESCNQVNCLLGISTPITRTAGFLFNGSLTLTETFWVVYLGSCT